MMPPWLKPPTTTRSAGTANCWPAASTACAASFRLAASCTSSIARSPPGRTPNMNHA